MVLLNVIMNQHNFISKRTFSVKKKKGVELIVNKQKTKKKTANDARKKTYVS